MAKQIKGTDIIEDGHLSNAIKQTQELLGLYKKLDETILKTAKDTKRVAQKTDTNKASGIQKLNKEVSKSNELKKASIQIDNQIVKAESKLISLDKQRAEQLARVKLETQRVNKAAKEQAILTSKTSTEYEKASVKLNKMRKRLKDLTLTEDKASKKTKLLAREVTKLDQKLKKADASAGQFQRNVGNYPKVLGGAIGSLKRMAGALGLVAGVQLFTRALRDAFNVVKNFDQAQANLASVLGISRDAMGALTKQAKELGATTKFTASQVAELQLEYAKLGFTMEQIEGMTEATLQLAAAAGTELGNAASIVGATMRGFGLDVTETQRVVDLMANSFSKSSLDIEKFKTGMSAVAPAASTAGFSIERTTALLGTLTNSGIDASTAGTGLRNIFLELTNKGLTFEQAMAKITNATDQNAAALALFGKRGATLGVILANNQTGVNDLTTALENSGGAAKEMADKQLDTLGGSLDILRSAWEGVILEMNEGSGAGEGLKDVIKDLAEVLPMIVKGIVEIVKALSGMTIGVFKNIKVVSDLIQKLKNGTSSFREFADALKDININILRISPVIDVLLDSLDDLGVFLGIIDEETTHVTNSQKALNIVNKQSLKIGREIVNQNKDEIDDIGILIDVISSEAATREEKNAAIAKLQETYPKMLENIDLETIGTEGLIAVKKELITTMLLQQLEQRKAEEQAKVIDELFDLRFKRDILKIKGLDDDIAGLTNRMLFIDEIAETIAGGFDEFANSVANADSGIVGLDSSISLHEKTLKNLNDRLSGLTKGSEIYKKTLKEIQKEEETLINLRIKRADMIKDGLDFDDLDDGDDSGDGGAGGAGSKTVDAEKEKLDKLKALQEKHNFELIELENDLIKQGFKKEEIEDRLNEKREQQFRDQLGLINELGFKTSETYERLLNKFLKFMRALGKEVSDLKEEIIEIDEELPTTEELIDEADEEDIEEDDKFNKWAKTLKALSKFKDEALDIFKEITDGLIENIDKRIEARRGEIDDANNNISRLQDLAAEGNTDAAEAIKAERIRVANEKLEIEQLEKRKRNLLIVVTALEKANQNLGQGDGNAFKNASASMKEFLAGLPTNYEGTAGTVAQALGKTGVRDGHVVRVHDNEHIIGANDSSTLHKAGFTKTKDIVGAAMASQNMALTRKAMSYSGSNIMTDQNIVSKLDNVEKAIKGIEITQQHIDLLGLKEVIKKGNKTIKNDYNPKWKI